MYVGIIGGGVGGLTSARECILRGHRCRIFESYSRVGGTWCIDRPDSAIYDFLRTNLPTALMRLKGLSWDENIQEDYVKPSDVDNYLTKYAKQFDLIQHVTFNSRVTHVSKNENGKWSLKYIFSNQKETHEDIFDVVIIANGHFNIPRIPTTLQVDKWLGTYTHSKFYKSATPYAEKVVCVVGAASSGRDITRNLDGVAKEVHVCDPFCSETFKIPGTKNTFWQPRLKTLIPGTNSCELEDGTILEVDVVIFCTGYNFSYEFLPTEYTHIIEGKRVRPVYQHIMHAEYPTLFFVGLNQPINPFPFVEVQAQWIFQMLDNPSLVPSLEERFRHVHAMDVSFEGAANRAHTLSEYGDQFSYLETLVDEAKLDPEMKTWIENDRVLYYKIHELRIDYPGVEERFRKVPISKL